MNFRKILISENQIIRDDGALYDRLVIADAVYTKDPKNDMKRFRSKAIVNMLIIFFAVMIGIYFYSEPEARERFKIKSVPLLTIGLVSCIAWRHFQSKRLNELYPRFTIHGLGSVDGPVLLQTNDEDWANATTLKLRELSDICTGNWDVDSSSRMITQKS
ncbi:hypothetical protein [Roseibium sp. SCP14]|uniref:hypothetical protein n=1 Tax=Roseibium sp. SCP14 TaxID=3141375 RepID=UPI00333B81A1